MARIISMNEWKRNAKRQPAVVELKDMSDKELFKESNELLQQLKKEPMTNELGEKSNAVLIEFNKRLEKDRDGFAARLKKWHSFISIKLDKLTF